MADRTFVPRELKDISPMIRMSPRGSQFYRVANELRDMSKSEGQWDGHFYVLPSVILFVAAIEGYFQEVLALDAQLHSADKGRVEKLNDLKAALGARASEGGLSFQAWIKEVFRFYDPRGKGIDPSQSPFQELMALYRVRNTVVHHNPSFMAHTEWPAQLEEAPKRSGIEVKDTTWINNLSEPQFADWAEKTIRETIESFCTMTGIVSPFDPAEGIACWTATRKRT